MRWLVAGLAVLVLLAVAEALASSFVLADLGTRPVVALLRGEGETAERIEVWRPASLEGSAPDPGQARFAGGEGVAFGTALRFVLPDGSAVRCTQRILWMSCGGGWRAERAGATGPR